MPPLWLPWPWSLVPSHSSLTPCPIMDKVRIITDSNVFLPPEIVAQHHVEIIPHLIKANGQVTEEKSTFGVDDLFAWLPPTPVLPRDQLPQVLAADINRVIDCYQ